MFFKAQIEKPLLALIFLSIGGWLLYLKIHPPFGDDINPANLIPFFMGLLNVLVVPILFNSKKTAIVAYLVNGLSVVIGSILMAHLSLPRVINTPNLATIFISSTLPDILLLLPKLFLGQIILQHYFPSGLGRMFTTFWWVKHFGYLSIIYFLGHLLGR
jgi:hypothetical protein